MAEFYLVGGAVRDSILGLPVKDFDYSVECESFNAMRDAIVERGGRIFQETPDKLTIRALDVSGEMTGIPKMGVDFVMCRRDGIYEDGRRPSSVSPGSLYDDLARRDFTMNAMAVPANKVGPHGEFEVRDVIDPFCGIDHLNLGTIRTVGNARHRFIEDTLRIVRAFRFSVTKGFVLDADIISLLNEAFFVDRMYALPHERIREELDKCFRYDSVMTIKEMSRLFEMPMMNAIFRDDIWLKPTAEKP